jgi:hypothetical protein
MKSSLTSHGYSKSKKAVGRQRNLGLIAMISSAKSLKSRYTDFVGLEYKSMTKYEEFLLIF